MMDALALNNQLCFRIYKLNRLITRSYQPMLKQLGLTYPQYLVMLVLWQQDNAPIKYLTEQLDLDTGTLSPLLKRLEKLGFIERKRSTTDERIVNIHLTKQGKALKAEAACVPTSLAKATGLSAGDIHNYNQALDKLMKTVS